uniref:Uncharacterized protein n=1 Tax=Aegilops tauschii TaxID=37682 RepID=R7W2Y0_AEGTA
MEDGARAIRCRLDSNTGSFESSEADDEYTNCLQAPASTAPCIPEQQPQQYVSQMDAVNSNNFYEATMHNQQFQGQWNAARAAPEPEENRRSHRIHCRRAGPESTRKMEPDATADGYYYLEGACYYVETTDDQE